MNWETASFRWKDNRVAMELTCSTGALKLRLAYRSPVLSWAWLVMNTTTRLYLLPLQRRVSFK